MSNAIFPARISGPMNSIVQHGSLWRTFVHCSDKLHQLVQNPNDFHYANNLVGGPTPMPNSPVAVICWGVETLQTRIYYITDESKVQEMCWTQGSTPWFTVGPTLGDVMECSIALYAQVDAHGDTLTEIRVGYQSARNPETITESYYTLSAGWNIRVYPNET